MSNKHYLEMQKRVEEAERRADKAEEQSQRDRRRVEKAKKQLQKAKEEICLTTLNEYFKICHDFLFTKFRVETVTSLTTKGSISNPQAKYCPNSLLPWDDFLNEQKTIFQTLNTFFPKDTKAFESRSFIRTLGERISTTNISSEKNLEFFHRISVETPVSSIIGHLMKEKEIKSQFNIGNGIYFETHFNGLSDISEEAMDRQSLNLNLPMTPMRGRLNHNQFRPDQICVYKNDIAGRSMAYIIEYKAPHKLTLQHLRIGLRQMDIHKEVVCRPTQPSRDDPNEVFQYHADKLVAAAVTQTFHYMIEGGLNNAFITTGEAIVFLKIDWRNPTKVYYHLAEPGSEVKDHPDSFEYCTAVAQVLAFTLITLSSLRDQVESKQEKCHLAINNLQRWVVTYEKVLESIPISERKAPPSSPAYQPRSYKTVDRSPYHFRIRKDQRGQTGCRDTITNDKAQSSESSDETQLPSSPSIILAKNHGQSKQSSQLPQINKDQGTSSHGDKNQNRQYCTQLCLGGLIKKGQLDKKCPNVSLHQSDNNNNYHPIDHIKWLQLLSEQLERTLDEGVIPLGKQGSRGAIFKVTLLIYGYTFISKGTVPEFVEDLKHEGTVYQHLQPIQGISVPIYLGAIDLRDISRIYFYDFRVRIIYMMFISWGGATLNEIKALDISGNNLCKEVLKSVQDLHAKGVAHTDIRKANAVWCEETHRVMMIDFERSILPNSIRDPLGEIQSNISFQKLKEKDQEKVLRYLSKSEYEFQLLNDIVEAKSITF